MKLRMTRRDAALTLGVFVLIVIVTAAQAAFGGRFSVLPALSTAAVLLVLLEAHRRLSAELRAEHREQDRRRQQDYRQLEALLSLFATLQPRLPLPATRDWAASPDLLKKLAELVLVEKPDLVVETGSGVSTLVTAYCLRRLGRGRVMALDHDANYAAITRAAIAAHGLDGVATIVHAPLTEHECDGGRWLWYDTHELPSDQPIDLLFVDGPPKDVQKLSRYPALPALYPRLNRTATILLDDGARDDEREIVTRWRERFPHLSIEFLDLEKGAYLIRRSDMTAQTIVERIAAAAGVPDR